jgi:hypothetical protein
MADPPKKKIGTSSRNGVYNLVKDNVAKNDRNHRLQVPQSSYNSKDRQINSSQQQKQNHHENEKSAPKPLLDCLTPGPLLTSKPYEKSMSQRRRKNKPFYQENLGTSFSFLNKKINLFKFF